MIAFGESHFMAEQHVQMTDADHIIVKYTGIDRDRILSEKQTGAGLKLMPSRDRG